jgi:hypothetical protein
MPCPGPREVTSTVTEHEIVAARDHVSTNAPAGSRGVASTRTSRSRPNATCTDTTSASSRHERRGRDPHARGQTRCAPRPPLRRGANHESPCRASPRACQTLRPHLVDLHARRALSCASILVTPPSHRQEPMGRVAGRARSAGLPRRVEPVSLPRDCIPGASLGSTLGLASSRFTVRSRRQPA